MYAFTAILLAKNLDFYGFFSYMEFSPDLFSVLPPVQYALAPRASDRGGRVGLGGPEEAGLGHLPGLDGGVWGPVIAERAQARGLEAHAPGEVHAGVGRGLLGAHLAEGDSIRA